jgi:hypothetical protein
MIIPKLINISKENNMNKCLKCNKETKNIKFCGHSCAASYTNGTRKPRTEESKLKTSKTLRSKPLTNQFGTFAPIVYQDIVGDFTRIYFCKCKFTDKQFVSTRKLYIHPSIIETKEQYTYQCRFAFAISDYPEWFKGASELIEQYGWYSTPGSNKKGITNINGISRDHLYSSSDGFKNNIDTKLLSHPANCRLLTHKENQSKGKNSSITIEELKSKIIQFEVLYGIHVG